MQISFADLLFKLDIIMHYLELDHSVSVQVLLDRLAEELAAANPVDEEEENGQDS